MAEPAVGATTARVYGELPELYRDADAAADSYPLLRYLSLTLDQASEIEALYTRLAAGEHLDAAKADAGWLPWLAVLTGVDLADVTDVQARRTLIAGAYDNRADGSAGAMRAQVAPLLTGTRTVYVLPHYGDEWTVAVVTLQAESAGTTAEEILAAASRQKPAGVRLVHEFGLTWDDLESGFPTWASIDSAGSWQGLMVA